MKAVDGEDFIIMPLYVSPLTGFLWLSEPVFPPLRAVVNYNYPSPPSRKPSVPAARVRAERHNPHSIATLRIKLARALIRQLPCCPFCGPKRL
jgi:hypothetical protein